MRDIIGFEGQYAITSCGRVWSYKTNRFLKLCNHPDGYLQINLCKDGKMTHHLVHRLVAEAYLENPNNYPCINHKSEIKTENHVNNLEYCTNKYNSNYGTAIERQAAKIRKKVYCHETNTTYDSLTAASKATGVDTGNISRCCKNKIKSCNNYHFKYEG